LKTPILILPNTSVQPSDLLWASEFVNPDRRHPFPRVGSFAAKKGSRACEAFNTPYSNYIQRNFGITISALEPCELMAIETVEASLEANFEELVERFGDKLDGKAFYELSSVVQGLRPWKDLFYETIGRVSNVNLHSNPDDPPDVTLNIAEKNLKISVEHTDFNNPMRGYVTGLHMSEFPSSAIFLPPVSQRHPVSREETLRSMFNPGQNWTTPMQTTQATAFQLEECVLKKLGKSSPDFLIVTDKLALDFNFDVAVMYVLRASEKATFPPQILRFSFIASWIPARPVLRRTGSRPTDKKSDIGTLDRSTLILSPRFKKLPVWIKGGSGFGRHSNLVTVLPVFYLSANDLLNPLATADLAT
jgi:hypothetical protein